VEAADENVVGGPPVPIRQTVNTGASGTRGAAAKTISLDDYLGKIIEGFLFGDLDAMGAVGSKPNGSLNYPIMMAVLAGTEVLGTIIGTSKEGAAVEYYWKEYMSRVNPAYEHLGELARVLLRNGLMHAFVTKPGVGVVKKNPKAHLTTNAEGLRIFDCGVLADHFKRSYFEHAKPDILTKRQRVERRLDEVVLAHVMTQMSSVLGRIPASVFPLYVPEGVVSGTPSQI
jgi:hypothetical protein